MTDPYSRKMLLVYVIVAGLIVGVVNALVRNSGNLVMVHMQVDGWLPLLNNTTRRMWSTP